VLEPIYERTFTTARMGSGRTDPRTTPWMPLEADLWSGVSCILKSTSASFFDTLDHAHLRAFLHNGYATVWVLRLIGKWLNAGVMGAGAVRIRKPGSPQGGVVSPLLANVYLHYVLDQWFGPRGPTSSHGRAFVVRYADDFVIGFTDDEYARRVEGRAGRSDSASTAPDDPTRTRPGGCIPQARGRVGAV